MARKRIVFTVAVLLILSVCVALFTACGGDQTPEFKPTTDNYRTMYQIFPFSFADSNGDGIGDINGIIDKLDYIADMNFDGIWLTPVHQSPSYHKYDVVDYKSIDSQFGTMEDYDRLVEECHKRGMTIILDLVINHTSDKHEWFDNCITAHQRGLTDDEFYNFYNIKNGAAPMDTWYEFRDNRGNIMCYEGQFWSGMPDLNWQEILDHPDGYLAEALKDVMKFWLVDHSVDGFRLDATGEFFSGDDAKNIECLKWIAQTAKSLKPDCYIVGEGPWGTNAYKYYDSGVDSFFLFNHGYSGTGSISLAARGMGGFNAVKYFTGIDKTDSQSINQGIPALFVANHDTPRAYSILQGGVSVDNIKMGYGVMAMSAGCTFWYYGDEVGMDVFKNAAGDYIDENKRQPMPWNDSYQCKPVAGSTAVDDSIKYPLGNVKQNLKDKNSIINYITRANALRRAFPAIARNYGKVLTPTDDYLVLIQKGEGQDAVYIAANLSHDYNSTIDLSEYGHFELLGTLSVDKVPTLKGNTIQMPAMTFAVLKKV